MTDPYLAEIQRDINEQQRIVQALQLEVYSQTDPAANADAFDRLAAEQAKLHELRQKLVAANQPGEQQTKHKAASMSRGVATRGQTLGEQTTGLCVTPKLCMDPLPTGAYHLMDPETDPLLTVEVENVSSEIRRVCVKSFIEGLSATAVRTIEIEPNKQATFNLQPTLFPERARDIEEIQRATLHLIVEDLDGKVDCHDTYPITCLARTASFNAVRRPDTGELLDISHYYGAWVTPHEDTVEDRIRRAVEKTPDRRMVGYQGGSDAVYDQVKAIYESLREAEIVYINSVIDYGAPVGMTTQRTRLPRESLAQRSANCIDGTVLMASLIEGVSLNPAIVLVPGHAFVGWEDGFGSGDWLFLETTMIGSGEFDAACQSAHRQYEQFSKYNKDKIKLHSVADLRDRGIWPME